MIKVFGTHTCSGCIELEALLKKNSVEYVFFNVSEKEGLAELALAGLADSLAIPIIVENGKKVLLEDFTRRYSL